MRRERGGEGEGGRGEEKRGDKILPEKEEKESNTLKHRTFL